MKRLFFTLLLFVTMAGYAYDFKYGNLYYNITSNEVLYTVEVSDAISSSITVTIPETVTYNDTTYSVTSIGDWAFSGCSSLTSVTIPNSVTSIGNAVFSSCSSFTSITIPNSVTSIGESAFYYCESLTSVTIPNSVTSIGNAAFSNCSSLTSVTIGNSVTSIGDWTFYNCSSLTSVTIGNSVTSIGHQAFYDCYRLKSITIPEGVTSIGDDAFAGCSSLTSVTIGNSVTSIGDRTFYYCESLTSVTIPNSVTSIGDYAFYHCSSLTSITIPNSVTSIGNSAFERCSSLTSVTIPNSVTSIEGSAFFGCSSLTSITIPNSVTSIGINAFQRCTSLSSIIVDSGNAIYDSRDNCNAIIETATNILIAGCQNTIIPNSVTSVGNSAFSSCSLTSITIPNSVTSIGSWAYADCSSLTSITIPESVTSIGDRAFYGCSSLTTPVYNAHCFAYLPTSFEGAYVIPEGIKQIAGGAFYGCSSLTSITIPNSVTNIGDYAFYGCSSLTSVTIPNSVTSIGDRAFSYCSSLTSIICLGTSPPDASNLGANTSTCKLIVPHSAYNAYLRHAYWGQFLNICTGYLVTLQANNDQWGEVTGDGLYTNDTTITITATPYEGYTFLRWSDGNTDNPRTLTLTQDTVLTAEFALTIVGQCGDNLYWSYDETAKTISITGSGKMYDYTASTQPWLLFKEEIKEVIIANTATSIGTSAFEGCIRLGKVSIGTAMENIGANAFANCRRLYEIYSYASIPPLAEVSSFTNYNATLYVPCEHKQYYQSDMVFRLFSKIDCISSEEVETDGVIVVPGANDVTITWLKEDGAETYSIVIKKDGEVVCTLTFNSAGQLINIAFAPGRNGNHPAQYAEQVANGKGYRFTVTGLEEGTHYTYNIDVKNTADQTINSYSGEFITGAMTEIENITTNSANIHKILRDNQLIIVRDGVEYTVMGQEL